MTGVQRGLNLIDVKQQPNFHNDGISDIQADLGTTNLTNMSYGTGYPRPSMEDVWFKIRVKGKDRFLIDTGDYSASGGTGSPHGRTVIMGDLVVEGKTTYIDTQNLQVFDNIILLNKTVSANDPVPTLTYAGIEISRSATDQTNNPAWLYDESNNWWGPYGAGGSNSLSPDIRTRTIGNVLEINANTSNTDKILYLDADQVAMGSSLTGTNYSTNKYGSYTRPSYTWMGDLTTGLWRSGSHEVGLSGDLRLQGNGQSLIKLRGSTADSVGWDIRYVESSKNLTIDTKDSAGKLFLDAAEVDVSHILRVHGDTYLSGILDVTGATHLHSTLQVDGATTISNTLHVTDDTTLDKKLTVGDTLDVTSVTHLHQSLFVDGNATFHADVDVDNGHTVSMDTLHVNHITGRANGFVSFHTDLYPDADCPLLGNGINAPSDSGSLGFAGKRWVGIHGLHILTQLIGPATSDPNAANYPADNAPYLFIGNHDGNQGNTNEGFGRCGIKIKSIWPSATSPDASVFDNNGSIFDVQIRGNLTPEHHPKYPTASVGTQIDPWPNGNFTNLTVDTITVNNTTSSTSGTGNFDDISCNTLTVAQTATIPTITGNLVVKDTLAVGHNVTAAGMQQVIVQYPDTELWVDNGILCNSVISNYLQSDQDGYFERNVHIGGKLDVSGTSGLSGGIQCNYLACHNTIGVATLTNDTTSGPAQSYIGGHWSVSGTLNTSGSGNIQATSATKVTGGTVTLTGPDVIGSGTFDGTGNCSVSATVNWNNDINAHDLAERYHVDQQYEPGTVMIFGGSAEITQSVTAGDHRVAGILSTKPSLMMNQGAGPDETHPYLALSGRLPCRVIGPIEPGDILETSDILGTAQRAQTFKPGCMLGKAIGRLHDGEGIVEVFITLM